MSDPQRTQAPARVAVVGGGIAGLGHGAAPAGRRRAPGPRSGRDRLRGRCTPGGNLRTLRRDGWQLEWGPKRVPGQRAGHLASGRPPGPARQPAAQQRPGPSPFPADRRSAPRDPHGTPGLPGQRPALAARQVARGRRAVSCLVVATWAGPPTIRPATKPWRHSARAVSAASSPRPCSIPWSRASTAATPHGSAWQRPFPAWWSWSGTTAACSGPCSPWDGSGAGSGSAIRPQAPLLPRARPTERSPRPAARPVPCTRSPAAWPS